MKEISIGAEVNYMAYTPVTITDEEYEALLNGYCSCDLEEKFEKAYLPRSNKSDLEFIKVSPTFAYESSWGGKVIYDFNKR